MPHWKRQGIHECVAGTEGETTPSQFAALGAERVFYKQFFSGFGNPDLDAALRELEITDLWIAGLYTHSCVRATVMDAYERGYRVTLVSDCVASTEALHAHITLHYLQGRAAQLATCADLLGSGPEVDRHYRPAAPAELALMQQRTGAATIAAITARAAEGARRWAEVPQSVRRATLERFAAILRASHQDLLQQIVGDIGKPRRAADDELHRACAQLGEAIALQSCETIDESTHVLYEPHGAVAVVTPWNNPVAIALGKIAAALLLGNSVVWKPAFQAGNIADALLRLLQQSGVPDNVVQIVNGGPLEVAALAAAPDIAAVSLTGPEQAGQAVAAICLPLGRPLQAELGGNNALLVLADADIEGLADAWALSAYGFAGQRCTAIRRFVVEASALARFERAMTTAVRALERHSPDAKDCDVGPMISAAACERAANLVEAALSRGARVICQGDWPPGPDQGNYFPPVLVAGLPDDDALVQEESFAPIAVVQVAADFQQGLALVNGVRQGLLAGIATASNDCRNRFVRGCEAGIVIDGAGLSIHPAAPFGGRKASQIGPPEHGMWDRQFFARPKAYYRTAPP